MIDWSFMPTLAVFQVYRGMNKFYKLISTTTRLYKTYLCIFNKKDTTNI